MDGESWQSPDNACDNCSCNDGVISCSKAECPIPQCKFPADPDPSQGQCCPYCKSKCCARVPAFTLTGWLTRWMHSFVDLQEHARRTQRCTSTERRCARRIVIVMSTSARMAAWHQSRWNVRFWLVLRVSSLLLPRISAANSVKVRFSEPEIVLQSLTSDGQLSVSSTIRFHEYYTNLEANLNRTT